MQHRSRLPTTPQATTEAGPEPGMAPSPAGKDAPGPGATAAQPAMITSGSPASQPASTDAALAVVIDTNVALDWLAFADPRTDRLAQAVESGRWRWVATPSMREELADVLTRPAFQRFDAATILARWDGLTARVPEPARGVLTCADPDDQVFIDLALALPAAHLLSRDKALRVLRRAASAIRGVEIGTPEDLPRTR